MRLSFAFRLSALSLVMTGLVVSTAASAQSLEDRIRSLESQIGQMESTPGQGSGAPVEIYGSLRTQLTYESVDADVEDDSTTDFIDAFSRIGIRTGTDIGDFKAAVRGEWKVNSGDNANFGDGRLAYVSLSHKALGSVAFGQQWGGYYNKVGAVVDVANYGSPGGYNELSGGTFRISNALVYTKSIAGVGVQVDVQTDGSDGNRDNLEAYGIAASYTAKGCTVGVAYRDNKADVGGENSTLAGISVGYKVGPAYLAASYNVQDDGTTKPKAVDLAATYSMGKNKLIAQYYTYDSDDKDKDSDTDGVILSVQHQMSDQFRVWTSLRLTDSDRSFVNDSNVIKDTNIETTSVDVGMRYDFSMSL